MTARHHHRPTRAGQAIEEFINLHLAPDIDPPRRFVEQKHRGILMEQPRDRDLLLITSGEGAGGFSRIARSNRESFDPLVRGSPHSSGREDSSSRHGGEVREKEVLRDRHR